MNIIDLMQDVTVGKLESVFEVVTVKKVNKHNDITIINSNNVEINGCKQFTITSPNNTFIQVPKEGSKCLMFSEDTTINANNSNFYLFAFSDLQEIILINNKNGGLVKVSELTNKLNIIESDLNTLKDTISNWIPVPEDGGASLKATLTSYYSNKMNVTKTKDLENENIKH